jgi:CHRD domain
MNPFSPSLDRIAVLTAMLLGLLAFGLHAAAQTTSSNTATLIARLSGASEVPPTPSNATGELQAALDKRTRVLTWTLSLQGLSGPATAANFHGPAMPGENAAAEVPISLGANNGVVTLTSAQVDDLMAGRWYVSVQTAANPNGEIRGQVMIGR